MDNWITISCIYTGSNNLCICPEFAKDPRGRQNFVDENGKTIIFRGLCFSDPVKLLHENRLGEEYFAEAYSWNANIVRFPVHPQNINSYGWDKTFEAIDQGIAWAKQKGMYVIIDWQGFDPHWAPTLITDWNYTLSTQGRYFKKYLQ